MQFKHSVFLITGGGSGLGAACARKIVSRGGRVAIADISEASGQALIQELGENACFSKTDVANESDVRQLIEQTVSKWGGLHGVVNCAGIATGELVAGKHGPHALDSFTRVLQVNLIGTFNVIRLAAAVMIQNTPNAAGERGVIVNTASVAAFDGQIGQAAYSASKGGIVGMTLPIAREFARHGIRVMTIAPGIFETPLLAGLPEDVRKSLGEQVPFPRRLGRPDEFAALVEHIVENEMLNGETIRLDGAIRMAPR